MKYVFGLIVLFCFNSSLIEIQTENKTPVVLHRFIPSTCNGDLDPYQLKDRIVSKEIKNDSLYLTVAFAENCCLEIDPLITFDNSVLNIELSKGTQQYVCDCNCCYELTLVLTGLDKTEFLTTLQGDTIELSNEPYPTYPISFELYQGDTINLMNKYGEPQGLWLTFDDSTGQLTKKTFYSGQVLLRDKIDWMEKYDIKGEKIVQTSGDTTWRYKNGVLNERTIGRGWGKNIVKYYSNGRQKSECIRFTDYDKDSIKSTIAYKCTYWDVNGNIDSTTREKYGPR